jgi:hypothetical protein
MSQQQPHQQYNIQIERKLSPLQNTLMTMILGMGALLMLFACCVIATMIISGLLGLGIFGALFSAILSQ